ncbi:MAG: head GIN domain-containing protein [Saprospiraceae bacterium]|nr:head GIN domain-containing protein [Saprospiraceae bacterium]
MKISFSFFLPAIVLTTAGFLFPFCLAAQSATVTRPLASFDKIGISGAYEVVFLKQGDAESVSLDVSGTDPAIIETEVKNGTLHIRTKKGNYSNLKAKITVTYRSLKSVANSGSSDIETLSPIKAEEFEFASSGSGDFKAELDVKDLDIAISGRSDLTLRGNADTQDIAISGSGDVNATALKGSKADVAISGSGDVKLGVSGKIKTAVSGSGSVTNN